MTRRRFVEGERLDDASDLIGDHSWVANMPYLGADQLSELLVVLEPWYREEFAPKRLKVSKRDGTPKVDKGSQHQARTTVYRRSEYRCEIAIPGVCTERAQEWHHRVNKGQGGRWDACNGLHGCHACHAHVTVNPTEAKANGWTVEPWNNPLKVSVLRRGVRVWLFDDGGFEPVERGAA